MKTRILPIILSLCLLTVLLAVAIPAGATGMAADGNSYSTDFSYESGGNTFPDESFENVKVNTNMQATYDPFIASNYVYIAQSKDTNAASLVYAFEGKTITSVSLDMLVMEGWLVDKTTFDGWLQVAAKVDGSDDFVPVSLQKTESVVFHEHSNPAYNTYSFTVTNAAALPDNTVELKITLIPNSSINYSVRLDALTIGLATAASSSSETTSSTESTTTTTESTTTTTTTVADPTAFVDGLDNLDKVAAVDGNLDVFAPHPATTLNVVGQQAHNSVSSLTYDTGDKTVSDISIEIMLAKGFFVLDRDLQVEVRAADGEWSAIELAVSDETFKGNDGAQDFNVATVTNKNDLPVGITQVKVTMKNDVAWTLFLDEVKLTYGEGSQDAPTGTTTTTTTTTAAKTTTTTKAVTTTTTTAVSTDSVKTGEDLSVYLIAGAVLLLAMAIGSTAFLRRSARNH